MRIWIQPRILHKLLGAMALLVFCHPASTPARRAYPGRQNTNVMDTLLQLTEPRILVPLALSSTLAFLAVDQGAAYLWKWSLWWGMWGLRYVAGSFIGDESWFQLGIRPGSAIASGFLVIWGALQAGNRAMPRWWVIGSLMVVVVWLAQTASGRFLPLSTAALIVPSGYMAVALIAAAVIMYRAGVATELWRQRRTLGSVLLAMGALQSTFIFHSLFSEAAFSLASQLSTALQLLITFAVVQFHFAKVRGQAEASHIELEQQLAKALDEFIPLCMGCKNVRIDDGPWQSLEGYLTNRTGTQVSHGVCPDCLPRLYPDYAGALRD
jgi:hypothetical protein